MRHIILLLSLTILLATGTARAGVLWNFDFTTDGGLPFAGELSTGDYSLSLGGYQINGLSGTFNGLPVSLVGPGGYGGNDNLLLPGAPWVDPNGVSFYVTVSPVYTASYVLWSDAYAGLTLFCDACFNDPQGQYGDTIGHLDISVAPEPAAVPLVAAGLALIGWRTRRRRV